MDRTEFTQDEWLGADGLGCFAPDTVSELRKRQWPSHGEHRITGKLRGISTSASKNLANQRE